MSLVIGTFNKKAVIQNLDENKFSTIPLASSQV